MTQLNVDAKQGFVFSYAPISLQEKEIRIKLELSYPTHTVLMS